MTKTKTRKLKTKVIKNKEEKVDRAASQAGPANQPRATA
jgi:hypothetical protein